MPTKHLSARDSAGFSALNKEAERLKSGVKSAHEPNSGERLLTPRDAANFLRVSGSWLAKARMRGDGPPYLKIGRSIRYGPP
jgi:hypothetical protein